MILRVERIKRKTKINLEIVSTTPIREIENKPKSKEVARTSPRTGPIAILKFLTSGFLAHFFEACRWAPTY